MHPLRLIWLEDLLCASPACHPVVGRPLSLWLWFQDTTVRLPLASTVTTKFRPLGLGGNQLTLAMWRTTCTELIQKSALSFSTPGELPSRHRNWQSCELAIATTSTSFCICKLFVHETNCDFHLLVACSVSSSQTLLPLQSNVCDTELHNYLKFESHIDLKCVPGALTQVRIVQLSHMLHHKSHRCYLCCNSNSCNPSNPGL